MTEEEIKGSWHFLPVDMHMHADYLEFGLREMGRAGMKMAGMDRRGGKGLITEQRWRAGEVGGN